jgi:signal transduction histidine kinase
MAALRVVTEHGRDRWCRAGYAALGAIAGWRPVWFARTAGLALLRVAQEAVTNAAKHGDGKPPTIALEYTDAGVELRVDNALPDAGAVEHPDTTGGYGLAGMHERLRLIDGELQAGPVGDHWVVQARVTR